MERHVDIYRAAHLAGVSMEEIQNLVSRGVLAMREGKVRISELRTVFPDLDFTGTKMVDVVDQIREDSILKAMRRKSGTHTIEEILEENRSLYRNVAYYKERSESFRATCYDLRHMLVDIREHVDQKHRVQNIISWLDQKMRQQS